MPPINTLLQSTLFVCFLSTCSISYAQTVTPTTPDEEQPVQVSANSLNAQEKQGISVYKGDVIVTQGSMTLKGDLITVRHPDSQLQTIKSNGNPASFQRFSQVDQAWLKGRASTIEYNALKKTILLIGKAQVEQPEKHIIKGPKLFYDMANQTLKAQGTEQGKGRITVTFNPAPPQKKENNPTPPPVEP
jgi:lipopolysaccharide export system protein LptA